MDMKILKSILSSAEFSNPIALNEWQSIQDEEEFPVIRPSVIDELSKTLTKLLSYNVSEKAYQRFSVRLHLIDTLRNWSTLKGDLGNLLVFRDSERTYEKLMEILKNNLSNEVLYSCDNVDSLVQLAEILLNALSTKRSTIKYFVKVMDRILSLNQSKKSEKFLLYVIFRSDELNLPLPLIENIYQSQKLQFIEKPFTDSFVAFCSEKNKESLNNIDHLVEKISDSPVLFQLVSNQLKEFFVMTKHAQVAQDFIKNVLDKVEAQCSKYNRDILDLYPINLQFCVILLRIKPNVHTIKSKDHTVQVLRNIFLNNHNDALELVSHFPEWLPDYLEFFNTIETLTQDLDVEMIDEIESLNVID